MTFTRESFFVKELFNYTDIIQAIQLIVNCLVKDISNNPIVENKRSVVDSH